MVDLIYLDYASTTPVDKRVVDEILPYFTNVYGNSSSITHKNGDLARKAVDKAQFRISQLIGSNKDEIYFTSGATESINLGLKGAYLANQKKGNHIITVKTEHKAVIDTCAYLEQIGADITYLDVNEDGEIDLKKLKRNIKDTTVIVCVMFVNNETGVIQPMAEIGKICEEKGVLLFSDATQAVGKIPTNPKDLGIHLMAFTAHKMYGPKGVGALFVNRRRPRVKLMAQIDGGGHEDGMRSGTLNVPGIVGFGKAAIIAQAEMENEAIRLGQLRNQLETALVTQIEACSINGTTKDRLPQVSNLSFQHVDSEGLLMTFNQNIAVATGSACTSASLDPSHVLTAMNISDDLAKSSIRFSLGRFTTAEEIDFTIEKVKAGTAQLRALSPVWEMFKEGLI